VAQLVLDRNPHFFGKKFEVRSTKEMKDTGCKIENSIEQRAKSGDKMQDAR
jgi:hypothetical protein